MTVHGYMMARVAGGRLLGLKNIRENGGNTVRRGNVDMFVIDRATFIRVARCKMSVCRMFRICGVCVCHNGIVGGRLGVSQGSMLRL